MTAIIFVHPEVVQKEESINVGRRRSLNRCCYRVFDVWTGKTIRTVNRMLEWFRNVIRTKKRIRGRDTYNIHTRVYYGGYVMATMLWGSVCYRVLEIEMYACNIKAKYPVLLKG